MDRFVVCDRCGETVDSEKDGCVEYGKEVLGLIMTLHMCLGCLEELIEESRFNDVKEIYKYENDKCF